MMENKVREMEEKIRKQEELIANLIDLSNNALNQKYITTIVNYEFL